MTAAPDHGHASWRKSTRSYAAGDCVEVAFLPEAIAIRDSKDSTGPVLSVSTRDWQLFLTQVRSGM